MGVPGKLTPLKLLTALDDDAIDFIRRSPFLVLSTADADGNQDVSPKGDSAGFVTIEDRNTILIPDRKGNKLLFGLQNILANPRVGYCSLRRRRVRRYASTARPNWSSIPRFCGASRPADSPPNWLFG